MICVSMHHKEYKTYDQSHLSFIVVAFKALSAPFQLYQTFLVQVPTDLPHGLFKAA